MAAAQGLFAEQNTDVVQSGHPTYADCASIAAASFTANKEYLILANALIECAGGAAEHHIRLVHGTTPTEFTDADAIIDPGSGANGGFVCGWMHRFTQPGTTELVKLEAAGESTNNITVLGSQVFALKLSDDFTENTDYYWNEVTTDYTTTGTMTAQATVTFTPNGTNDWLIIAAYAQGLSSAQTTGLRVEIHDSVTSSVEPAIVMEGEDSDAGDENRCCLLARVFTPSNASHTFSIRFGNVGANTFSIFSSRIFALNLSKFNQHAAVYTSNATTPSASPTWSTIATVSATPSVTGDWFYLASHLFDVGTATAEQNIRLQHDNSGSLASDPAYGDDGVNAPAFDATDDMPLALMKMRSLTSGASRTINYDATNVNGTGTAKQRSLVAFSLELASGGSTVSAALAGGSSAGLSGLLQAGAQIVATLAVAVGLSFPAAPQAGAQTSAILHTSSSMALPAQAQAGTGIPATLALGGGVAPDAQAQAGAAIQATIAPTGSIGFLAQALVEQVQSATLPVGGAAGFAAAPQAGASLGATSGISSGIGLSATAAAGQSASVNATLAAPSLLGLAASVQAGAAPAAALGVGGATDLVAQPQAGAAISAAAAVASPPGLHAQPQIILATQSAVDSAIGLYGEPQVGATSASGFAAGAACGFFATAFTVLPDVAIPDGHLLALPMVARTLTPHVAQHTIFLRSDGRILVL